MLHHITDGIDCIISLENLEQTLIECFSEYPLREPKNNIKYTWVDSYFVEHQEQQRMIEDELKSMQLPIIS